MFSRAPWRSLLTLAALSARALSLSAAPEPLASFAGTVVAVKDGDSIQVLEGRTLHEIRLWGIDCPERNQAFGTRAKRTTSDLAFGKPVTVRPLAVDRYKRLVSRVRLPDGTDLSAEVIRAGMAWWYEQYAPRDAELARLEREARAARRGLWADPHPVPPWVFRRHKR